MGDFFGPSKCTCNDLPTLAIPKDKYLSCGASVDVIVDGALQAAGACIDRFLVVGSYNRRIRNRIPRATAGLADHGVGDIDHRLPYVPIGGRWSQSSMPVVATTDDEDDRAIGTCGTSFLERDWTCKSGSCQGDSGGKDRNTHLEEILIDEQSTK